MKSLPSTRIIRNSVSFLAFGLLTMGAVAADSSVIARVGDTEVKVDDIRPLLENLSARDQAALARDPKLLNQLVRSVVVQQILLKEAQASKWEQQPAVVAQLARLRQNAIAESYLQSVTKPAEGYPSEADLQAAYQANKAAIVVPRQIQLAQIFIALPKNADKAATDKAQAQLDAIRKNLHQPDANFAVIANAASGDKESAGRGGEIGWLTEAQIQPEIRSQIVNLAKNSVSEPIRLNDGWHILKVLDVKEAYTPTLEAIHDQLAQQLRTAKVRANSEAYVSKLLQQNTVAINEIALSQLLNKTEK